MRVFILLIAAFLWGISPSSAHADAAKGWQLYLMSRYAEARDELMPLAQAGDPDAQYYVGTMYSDGHGVPRDPRQAVRWFEAAARRGHLQAEFSLGFLLLYGAGTGDDALAGDVATGLPWIEMAARQGFGTAQYFLGNLYWTGGAVAPDHAAALRWTVAANQGIAGAEYQAGMLYADERGVNNVIEAYKWLELAARAGYPDAAEKRNQLARDRLTSAEVRQAKELADVWRANDFRSLGEVR